MAIRVSGLVSGLDTDSIVQELVSAYSKKKDKTVKAQTKLEWKMDAWKELNKKVNTLYKRLGNMKLSSYYNKKTTSISDSTKATVTASNSAINGTQSLKIMQVATTGYITGAQIKHSGTTSSTTLGELGLAGDGTISVATKNGAKNTDIEVTADMKISDFVNKLKEAGVSASYDAAYNRMYISAKDSGAANDFSLTAADANGLQALKSLGIYTKSAADNAAYAQWDNYAVDTNGRTRYVMDMEGNFALDPATGEKIKNAAFDENNIDANATKAYFEQILDKIDQYQGDGVGSIKELEDDNADLRTQASNLQTDRNYATSYMSMKEMLAADKEDGSGTKLTTAEQNKLQKLLEKENSDLTEADKTDIKALQEKLGYSDKEFSKLKSTVKSVASFEADTENAAVVSSVQGHFNASDMDTWLTTNGDAISAISKQMQNNADTIAQKKQFIQENQLLTASAPANDTTTNADRADALMARYNYAQAMKNSTDKTSDDPSVDGHAVRTAGSDAKIELNGVEYVSSSNSITVNGLTVTALQKTDPGETLSVTTQADVQGMYDTIKDFLKEYNALIKEMDELYNADSAKGYEPLTDDEKEAMSDKEIEKWEEKIKGSILRRDDTLSSVMSLMTNTMSKGFTLSDGKKYSLSSFGIKTQGYLAAAENEGYVYHIDGDSEDEVSSGKTDKLLAALQQDPDMVQEFFQKLSDDLYTKLDKKMQSTTLNSKFSIYHDKKMQSDYDRYTQTIKKWEEKVTSMEDYYYKKFSAMEKALSTLQQSTSALSGLLGS